MALPPSRFQFRASLHLNFGFGIQNADARRLNETHTRIPAFFLRLTGEMHEIAVSCKWCSRCIWYFVWDFRESPWHSIGMSVPRCCAGEFEEAQGAGRKSMSAHLKRPPHWLFEAEDTLAERQGASSRQDSRWLQIMKRRCWSLNHIGVHLDVLLFLRGRNQHVVWQDSMLVGLYLRSWGTFRILANIHKREGSDHCAVVAATGVGWILCTRPWCLDHKDCFGRDLNLPGHSATSKWNLIAAVMKLTQKRSLSSAFLHIWWHHHKFHWFCPFRIQTSGYVWPDKSCTPRSKVPRNSPPHCSFKLLPLFDLRVGSTPCLLIFCGSNMLKSSCFRFFFCFLYFLIFFIFHTSTLTGMIKQHLTNIVT